MTRKIGKSGASLLLILAKKLILVNKSILMVGKRKNKMDPII